jgi:hypothetical protein
MSKWCILDLSYRKCRSSLIVMFASAAMSGCASSPAALVGSFQLRGPATNATITVENRRLTDISVYAIVGDTRVRLGAVETMSSRTFAVPRIIQMPSDIELFATARADDDNYSSLPIAVRPGDSILCVVEQSMKFSMLLRR